MTQTPVNRYSRSNPSIENSSGALRPSKAGLPWPCFLAVFLSAFPVLAAENPRTLSWDDCVQIASSRNPDLSPPSWR